MQLPWADPDKKELVDRNDFHVLVNGCYMGGEIAYDNQRFEMFVRLLNGWSEVECSVAEEIAISFAEKTRLPAFAYKGPNALKVGEVPEYGPEIYWRIEYILAPSFS